MSLQLKPVARLQLFLKEFIMRNSDRSFPCRQRRGTKLTTRAIFFLFTLPAVLLYLYFIVYPLLNGLYYSLTDWNGVGRSYQFVGLANYYKIFHDKTSMSVVGRTFLYTLLLTVICTALSVFLAILLNREMKGKSVFRSIYFFPAVLSSITIGLIFNQIYNSLLPQVGSALGIGALSHSLLSSGKTAMWAILFINVWQGTALPTVIAIAGLQAIPVEIRESAKMDGASAWQEFCHVTLPLLMPTISVIIILNVRSGLMVFDYIKATTDGGPGFATMSIAMEIYKHAFTDMKFAYSSAESTVTFLLITVIAIIQLWCSRVKE